MIDLPMKAEVHCSDGIAGVSTHIIANPLNQRVTHLVIQSLRPPFNEYLVPIDEVEETTPNQIQLKCTRSKIDEMDPFVYEEYIYLDKSNYIFWPYSGTVQPINPNEVTYMPVKHHNVPRGEVAVWRGAKVQATDGYVGQVDELLVNSKNMKATHLVLRERHMFNQTEITIPVSQIERVDENTIYLKLDRKSVEGLPVTPIQRWQLQAQGK